MLYLANKLKVKCSHCGNVIQIDSDDFFYTTTSYERNMGDGVEYTFNTEISCYECQNEIFVIVRGSEYPVGALEYSDSECQGGELLTQPSLEVEYECDDEIEQEEDTIMKHVHELVERCNVDYVKNASKYICKDCSHPKNVLEIVGNVWMKFIYREEKMKEKITTVFI